MNLQEKAGERTDFLVELFEKYDQDDSGSIEVDELQELMKAMGLNCGKEVIKNILDEIDKDQSGSIDKDEFIEFMSQIDDLQELQNTLQFEAAKHNRSRAIAMCYFTVNFILFFMCLTMHFNPDKQGKEKGGLDSFIFIGLIISGATFGISICVFLMIPLGKIWAMKAKRAHEDRKAVQTAQKPADSGPSAPEKPPPSLAARFGGASGIHHNPIAGSIRKGDRYGMPAPPVEPPPVWQSYRRPQRAGAVAPYDEEQPPPPNGDRGSYRRASRSSSASSSSTGSTRGAGAASEQPVAHRGGSFNHTGRSSTASKDPYLGTERSQPQGIEGVGYYAPEHYFSAQHLYSEAQESAGHGPTLSFNPYLAQKSTRQRPQSAPAATRSLANRDRPQSAPLALTNASSYQRDMDFDIPIMDRERSHYQNRGSQRRPHSAAG